MWDDINYSYKTAMSRKKLSAPARWLKDNGLITDGHWLDFGSGKGYDGTELNMTLYDPYYSPWDLYEKEGTFSGVMCNYVLNTLKPNDIDIVQYQIFRMLNLGGIAYITARCGLKRTGKTSKGYQYNVILELPIIHRTSSYIIYEMKR